MDQSGTHRGMGRSRDKHTGGGTGPYASYAWRLVGLFRSEAAWLDVRDGLLRFSTPEGVVFDVPLDEVTGLSFPWHYSSGGLKLTVAGEEYRLAFVEPNGARYPSAESIASGPFRAALARVAAAAAENGTGRKVGREWRRRLEGRTGS